MQRAFSTAHCSDFRLQERVMQGDIVAQGIELMLFGMGTVFVFLTLLVFATTGMSRIVSRYFPEPIPAADTARNANTAVDARLVAVISAAVQRHRVTRAQGKRPDSRQGN
ncbi:MAG: hypothetical protein Hals2KO_20510 [Halioglobus sp.]